MRVLGILLCFAIVLLGLYYIRGSVEGFAYASNPCKAFKDCRSCADAAGCGWCPDLRKCQPMAQDGFPIRTKDNSTGDIDTSPYLNDALPVLESCPPNCKQTDLGDCDCLVPSFLNSCPPDCYAVYNTVGSGPFGSELAGSNTESQMNCMCPNSSGDSKPGPYERRDYLKRLRAAGVRETPDVMRDAYMNSLLEMEDAKKMIGALQKSTRIHICSPHTYVIDSKKC